LSIDIHTPADVVIVGAGPAGLSAALVLGRACRRVVIFDKGTPRNANSKAIYAFLTRDGTHPESFRRIARQELRPYRNVQFRRSEVTRAVRRSDGTFDVWAGAQRLRCRKLLIATGVVDELPNIPGVETFFGSSVFQCPYCDGWELRGQRVAVYGRNQRGFEMARSLTAWTRHVALCTHGPTVLSAMDRRMLNANEIPILEQKIARLCGRGGKLDRIEFTDGHSLACAALFFDTRCRAQSGLAESLGCQFNRRGGIRCGEYEATSVPGVFVAGNIIKDVQLAVVAAAEGARAAFGINRSLTREDFERKGTRPKRKARSKRTHPR
jgi:thioredoxin reductase